MRERDDVYLGRWETCDPVFLGVLSVVKVYSALNAGTDGKESSVEVMEIHE